MEATDLERALTRFGREIFTDLARYQPKVWNRMWYLQQFFRQTAPYPEVKTAALRFIERVPLLTTADEVRRDLHTILLPPIAKHSPALAASLKLASALPIGPLLPTFVRSIGSYGAQQFIVSDSIEKTSRRFQGVTRKGFLFSADILAEFAESDDVASETARQYHNLLEQLQPSSENATGPTVIQSGHPLPQAQVSVKLTALAPLLSTTPRMTPGEKRTTLLRDPVKAQERLTALASAAQRLNVNLTVDAEDVASNELIYETFESVFGSGEHQKFPLPGIVVQAYLREAPRRLKRLLDFARSRGSPIAIRLVKGAYAETETARAQEAGTTSPLVTSKREADRQFEELTRILFEAGPVVYPCIASHNIRSLSHTCVFAESIGRDKKSFELQMLYGMADPIALTFQKRGYTVRLYCPIGDFVSGMGYFVRRLLENTSNESFLRLAFISRSNAEELLQPPRSVE